MRELTYTSKNGIKLYGIKNPGQHGFYISLVLRAGSMYEGEGESGITHFLEHVLIRNVNKLMRGELYRTLDKYGIEFNASTYAEMVQFYITGARENIGVASEIITRLFDKIVLTASDIEPERRRIKAEIREGGERTSLAAFSSDAVHKDTSLARSITGTLGSVSKIGVSRLEEYRRRTFTAENLFFYLTGCFEDSDAEYILSLADSYTIKHAPLVRNIAPVPEDFMKRAPEVHIKNADYFALRFTFDLDMTEMTVAESDILYDVLLSGYGSRFFMELGERRGLFYDVSGALERYNNIGTLHFTYEVRREELYEALSETVKILNGFKHDMLSDDECMKAGYVDNAYMLYDDYRELNFTFLYDNHILGANYGSIDERRAAYSGITPERIAELSGRIFTPERLTFTMKGKRRLTDKEKILGILSGLSG